ncbi:MAG: two-component regulator propeller domain-containing protein [Bacteroidota bacterium]
MLLKAIVKYKLLIPVLLLQVLTAYQQSFTTRLYTTADGLSDNYIFRIYQDSYGYLWVGTANGLNRFDGKRFLNFGLRQGLPSLYVDVIYEDRNHRLWIGTRKGVAELKGDSCYTYPVNDKQDITFVSGFLEPGPGKLWVTTDRGLYELKDSTWIKIKLYPGYDNKSISKIISTSKGTYINYSNNKLIRLEPNGSWKVLLSENTNRAYYNSLWLKNDTVYISTYKGLMYLKQDKWVQRFEDTLKKKYIYCSYADSSNRFWFGTREDGVLAAIPDGDKIIYLHLPLSFNMVSYFLEDRDKNIWVAGFQGLLKVSPSPYSAIAPPGFESFRNIRNHIITPSGSMVVSGENGKLLIIKPGIPTGGSPQIIAVKELLESNDFIDFHCFDDGKRMWFTTRNGFLYRLDDVTLTNMTSIVGPPNNTFRAPVYNQKLKQLFVCGDSVLLYGNEYHLDTFFSSNNRQFIPLPYIIHIDQESGAMLVQTLEDGLYRITPNKAVYALGTSVDLSLSIQNKVPGKKNETMLWAAYRGKGIYKYLWQNNDAPRLMDSITEKDGFPVNYILSLSLDKEEKLWLATTKGVTVLQKDPQQQWIHHHFEINEPGTSPLLSFARLRMDDNGNMWMSIRNKLLVFDSKKARVPPQNTNTVIEKVLLFDRPTNWSLLTDDVESYRRLPVNPVLKHDQNTLSIGFNALQFISNSQPEYTYRLVPADTAWSSPTPNTTVSFYQLAPGKYRFEVRSHIRGFAWSSPASFSFIIKKPFWETWWFRLAFILAASAVIIFIFRYRLKQIRTKTQIENQLRELEMRALKAQMNPHFIHNALNSIQSLIMNNQSALASHYISKFAKLLRQVLENADANLISLDKELYSLQLYVDLEKLRMNLDIDYKEQVDEKMLSSDIKIPPLILQPFVENALWHGLSLKEGEKSITVTIMEQQEWLICEITDNGIGRKKAAESYKAFPEGHLSKAIKITRQKLADFNQSPGVDPVSFIDLEENGVATGTRVIIRIKAGFSD